jgi:hypothetical protein
LLLNSTVDIEPCLLTVDHSTSWETLYSIWRGFSLSQLRMLLASKRQKARILLKMLKCTRSLTSSVLGKEDFSPIEEQNSQFSEATKTP